MNKQAQNYIVKVWCIFIAASPVLFVALMVKSISGLKSPLLEALLTIAISIGLGLLYFSPSLFITLIIARYIANSTPLQIKLTVAITLFLLICLQLFYLYHNNLCLIYKGSGAQTLSYLAILIIACSVCKLQIDTSRP